MVRLSIACSVLVGVAAIVDPDWETFKAKYKKFYEDSEEEIARYTLFTASKARVAHLNMLNGQPAFGITWMSDRRPEEMHKKGYRKPRGFVPTAPVKDFNAPRNPSSIDWRFTEAVTPVKNQGQCGSCWAFSATEAIEAQMALTSGGKYNIELSPQQIVSCAPDNGTWPVQGCNGGFTEGAYEYVKSATGLSNGFFIPYQQSLTEPSATVPCMSAKVQALNGPNEELQGNYVGVRGYSYALPPCQDACEHQDLRKLAAALETSPVSVCVNAGNWNDYVGGVMTSAACGSMAASEQDHCVMVVGFNATGATPYWIVRNSWSTTWGEQGYIYLEMAKNTCGLADDATIPHVQLDLSQEELAEAVVRREAMYQRATLGSTQAVTIVA